MTRAAGPSKEQLGAADSFVRALEADIQLCVQAVETGPYVRGVSDGSFPLDGIRFVHTNRYHVAINDLANLNLYVARARGEEETLCFHAIAAAAWDRLNALYGMTDALGIDRSSLVHSEPDAACLVRTNYESRLAQYGLPGEIALALSLALSIRTPGAEVEARGLSEHYDVGAPAGNGGASSGVVPDSSDATADAFRDDVVRVVARDLSTPGTDEKISRAGRWAAAYEAAVWDAFYAGGVVAGGTS